MSLHIDTIGLNALSHLEQANGFLPCGFFMSLHIDIMVECIVTFGAGKWFFSCVGPFMYLHMDNVVEFIVTLGAGKFFSHV